MPSYKRSPESPWLFSKAWVLRFSGCKVTLPATKFTASTSHRTRRLFENTQKGEVSQQTASPQCVGSSTPPRQSKRLQKPSPPIPELAYLPRGSRSVG